ncbi:MAG TPA: AAA family ATPase [Dongiaceae bacterium]|nr:AAA family ATPase [Dongiaceae bacterium]
MKGIMQESLFLAAITRRPEAIGEDTFPWSLPALRDFTELRFERSVTFLVGENGAGKSTLLEGMAVLVDSAAMGSHDLKDDPTLEAARSFAAGCRHVRRKHARTRMFLRAEDVFGFVKHIDWEIRENPSGQAGLFRAAYGDNPDARSHGETFLEFLTYRMQAPGLYILDEPETPLSPSRILALMHLIQAGVAKGSQFVIATHSPILMAYPGAAILEVSPQGISSMAWEDVEHVKVTRAFLRNPRRYLDELSRDAELGDD